MQKIGDFYMESIGTCVFLYARVVDSYFLVSTFYNVKEVKAFAKANQLRSGIIKDKLVFSVVENT